MTGVLLDSHALYWLVSGEERLADAALAAIVKAQDAGSLLVSPITAWELAVATRKSSRANRPDLGDTADLWFRDAVAATTAKVVPIQQRIAIEAAKVVVETGHKDPGDCFLIATARVRGVPIITRDAIIRGLADDAPEYLTVIVC